MSHCEDCKFSVRVRQTLAQVQIPSSELEIKNFVRDIIIEMLSDGIITGGRIRVLIHFSRQIKYATSYDVMSTLVSVIDNQFPNYQINWSGIENLACTNDYVSSLSLYCFNLKTFYVSVLYVTI